MRTRWWISLAWCSVFVGGCSGDDGSASSDPTTTASTSTSGSSTGEPVDSSTSSGVADSSSSGSTGPGEPGLPARLGVTAEWQARTLSVIDLDAIAAGAQTREEIVARTIDLQGYAPGPLQVELAPDGVTALVAVSPGFFGGFVGNAIGAGDVVQDGTLLVVDLLDETVTEIETLHVPMGIAIEPSGARAFTANYGLDDPVGTTMSVVDLAAGTVLEEVEVGERPEQVSLSADGSLGLLNVVGLGGVRVFETADPSGTLSAPLELGTDPSDVDFVPGTTLAVVANSLDPSNYVVIDVADPSAPVEVAVGPAAGIMYGVTHVPGTTDVLLTASDFTAVRLVRAGIGGDGTPSEQWQVSWRGAGFPLGVAVDGDDGLALVAVPGLDALVVQPLDGGAEVIVPWQEAVGPTYVAVAG